MVALIAFIGVSITVWIQTQNFKKQIKSAHTIKIAEMRQAWINDLRSAMSKFQSYGVTPNLDHSNEREFYEAGTRIELLMNPKDSDYPELQACLYSFLQAQSLEKKYEANPKYVAVCQRVLKREWETLKGELTAAT
jgi:hypothetical protein